jgi:hypothetical protein
MYLVRLSHRSAAERLGLIVISMICAISSISFIPSAADAGTYKLYSCNVPGKDIPVPSTAPWTAKLDGLNTLYFDDCAAGGSFGIGLNVKFMHAFSSASLALIRPADGPKSVIGIVRYRTWLTAELAGAGAPAFIDEGGAFSPPGGTTSDGAPWVSPPYSQTNPAIYVRLRCSSGDCSFESARPLQARGIEVDLYEDIPPSGEIEGGTIFDSVRRNDQRTLSFSAVDQESGITRVDALLGDTIVATHDLSNNNILCAHIDLNACPSRYAADFVINLSGLSPGDYPVTLRITDAAGNRRIIESQRHVSIGNTVAAPGGKAQLSVRLADARSSSYATNFGRSVRLRGRLADPSGKPLGNTRIMITERPLTLVSHTKEVYATTDSDGRFSYAISGRGPSRAIEVKYFARVGDARPSAYRRLHLQVRAASTLKLSLRGVTVRYSGRVLSRPFPRNGKQVFIQGRALGGVWQRFAFRRTDRNGRFSGRYRLRVRRPGVRLQFRVEVPKEPGYPFAARVGKTLTRVVR